nr:unnamed protein product [Digitaria exilis]
MSRAPSARKSGFAPDLPSLPVSGVWQAEGRVARRACLGRRGFRRQSEAGHGGDAATRGAEAARRPASRTNGVAARRA